MNLLREKFFVTSAIGGVVGFLVLLAVVFATGQTFGQRCGALYPDNRDVWRQCVTDLSEGVSSP